MRNSKNPQVTRPNKQIKPAPPPVRLPSARKMLVVLSAMTLLLGGLGLALTRVAQSVANFGAAADPTLPPNSLAEPPAPPPREPGRRRRTTPPPPAPKVDSEGKPVCVPKTCRSMEIDCGNVDDGCGGTLNCGGCLDGFLCAGKNGHTCEAKCEPLSCKERFADCGQVDDGCGKTIDCGTCKGGLICGGTGIPNECGKGTCVPYTCRQRDLEGGRFSDGCGGIIEC